MKGSRCFSFVFLFFILSTLASTVSWAAVIRQEKSVPVDTSRSLWKPADASRFSDTVFCFTAEGGLCNGDKCDRSLLCTFDAGQSAVPVEVHLPYCGDKGVVIDGQLHCAGEQLPSAEKGVLAFSVVVFSPQEDRSLSAVMPADKQFRFQLPAGSKPAYKQLLFVGSTLVMENSAERFILPLMAVSEDDAKTPVVFSSADGLNWKYLSKLPFTTPSTALYAVRLGTRKVCVVSQTAENAFEKTTSNYLGRWWPDVKQLNSTAPPFTLVYPSSLVLEYGTTNSTPLSATYHAEDFPKLGRKSVLLSGKPQDSQKAPDQPNETRSPSSRAVVYQASPDRFVAFYDALGPGNQRQLHMSTFSVDDSEEMTLVREQTEKKEKKKAEEEAARIKAQQERRERQAKERQQQREKELARRKAFDEKDAPNIALARQNYGLDGDFIVVRPSSKDTLDLEKSAFFW